MIDDLLYQIALTIIPGVGGITARKLISYCGGAEAVFNEKKNQLQKIPGIGSAIAHSIANTEALKRAEQELTFINKHGIRAISFTEKVYPYRLKQCEDGPVVLYVKGDVDLNTCKMISIVGTRNITKYGRQKCMEIIEGLKDHNILVVSGLAYGVDACAHKTALDHGLKTVAVLGHGLDRIYPSSHTNLAKKMLKQGGLLTDFISGTTPDRENFPKRNRIIAGMCDAVIVIEAAITGGALITANIANSYNRDVFALPGRTCDAFSMGCNKLIKTHKANLIESVADLEYVMNWKTDGDRVITAKPLFADLNSEEEKLVEILKQYPEAGIDCVATHSGLSTGRVSAILLNLEFKDVVTQLPGKQFKLNEVYL
jgi:DNA processing protein